MASARRSETVRQLLAEHTVVDMATIRAALGGVCAMTAFRHLRDVPYRRSYNHNGRYYTLHDPSRYDRFGLWSVERIHFSIDGSLRSTVRRLVEEADAGATHHELEQRLRWGVHHTLLNLFRDGEIDRERLLEVYVYLHADADVRCSQRARRQELIEQGRRAAPLVEEDIDPESVIEVLLTVLRHRGAGPREVVRHLRGRAPPIPIEQVRAIFDRYALDELGEKGGTSKS